MRQTLPGVHWPVYIFTDAKPPEQLEPVTTGPAYHALHGAMLNRPCALQCAPVQASDQPLTMLFKGTACQLDSTMLLDSGASDTFISPDLLARSDTPMHSTSASLQMASGATSPIEGRVKVKIKIGGFSCHINLLC